jgi:dTDP-4-dehydrorhamnose reductase
MKVLILGGNGMLGHKLVQKLGEKFEVWTTVRASFNAIEQYGIFDRERTLQNIDVASPDAVQQNISNVKPDVVVNAIGVIKQLPTSKDVITTLTANSIFPQQLAELSADLGFRLICIGTDCVFLGTKGRYTEDDPADALDLYGRSKYFGEVVGANCLTLRTSIIGRELQTSHSLVEWFLGNRGKTVNGYVNAIYSGFPTIILADIISDLIFNFKDLNGLYHVSSEPINKFDLLNLINDAYKAEIEIKPFEDFHIDRSLDSSKFSHATGFKSRPWKEMIKIMADDSTLYELWRKTQA